MMIVNDKLRSLWKKAETDTTKNFSQGNLARGRESNLRYPEYEATVCTNQQRRLMDVTFIRMLFKDAVSIAYVMEGRMNNEVRKL
jgi:hypothetical protein